jgi:hypothetical protein
MAYPNPADLRRHADHARQMADEYRAEGQIVKADQREADADFYEDMADREEWRLSRISTVTEQKRAA